MNRFTFLLSVMVFLNVSVGRAETPKVVRIFGHYVAYRADNIYIVNGERIFSNGPRPIEEDLKIASVAPPASNQDVVEMSGDNQVIDEQKK